MLNHKNLEIMKTQQLPIKQCIHVLCVVTIFSFFTGCSKEGVSDDDTVSQNKIEEFNTALAALDNFEQPAESSPTELSQEAPERDTEDTSLECVVKHYKAAPGYNELLALDPTSDVIYPGGMLKGESIPTGEYIGINGGRAPITLSVSLENINGTASVEVENPSLSTVRNGISSILQQGVSGATPAKINFELSEVYSEEHLNLALGANYRSGNRSVSASFDFSNSQKKYKYVLKYFQVYYTIDMDLPENNNPGSLFKALPNLNSTSPVMVSSVKYGRMVLYTIESDYEKTDVQAAFSASFESADANGNLGYQNIVSSSNVKALVIGGSGEDAAQVITGPSGVHEYITNGGNYSADSPAAPLGYTLRYIKNDFPIAKVVLSSEYALRSCDLAYPRFKVELIKIRVKETPGGTEGSHLELFGNVRGRLSQENGGYVKNSDGSQQKVEWYRSESNNLQVEDHHHIYESIEFEVYRPNYNDDYVYLSGHLYDKDWGVDDLGFRDFKFKLKDIPYNLPGDPDKTFSDDNREFNVRLDFDEKSNHEARAYFAVTRIK